jgi:hypothetical protein
MGTSTGVVAAADWAAAGVAFWANAGSIQVIRPTAIKAAKQRVEAGNVFMR